MDNHINSNGSQQQAEYPGNGSKPTLPHEPGNLVAHHKNNPGDKDIEHEGYEDDI